MDEVWVASISCLDPVLETSVVRACREQGIRWLPGKEPQQMLIPSVAQGQECLEDVLVRRVLKEEGSLLPDPFIYFDPRRVQARPARQEDVPSGQAAALGPTRRIVKFLEQAVAGRFHYQPDPASPQVWRLMYEGRWDLVEPSEVEPQPNRHLAALAALRLLCARSTACTIEPFDAIREEWIVEWLSDVLDWSARPLTLRFEDGNGHHLYTHTHSPVGNEPPHRVRVLPGMETRDLLAQVDAAAYGPCPEGETFVWWRE